VLSDLSDKLSQVARLSATEAARNFSAVLNRVVAGEEIEVTRNGTTIAVIGPPKTRLLSPERLRELLSSAPPVDGEFAADVQEIRSRVGPAESSWPS
jgi:prevent-host-death family protein